MEYATFEGNIPRGQYGGGSVMLADIGRWQCLNREESAFESGEVKIMLFGRRFQGRFALIRTEGKNWLIIKENDEPEPEDLSRSVKSGRTMDQIASETELENPFDSVKVMLATPSESLPEGENWQYEIKFDGYRITAFCERGKVRLLSRGNVDHTLKFSAVAESLERTLMERTAALDGEVAVYKDGRTDFSALSHYDGKGDIRFEMFDLLALDGADLRDKPLRQRQQMLSALFAFKTEDILSLVAHVPARDGKALMSAAFKHGLEGIVAKRTDSKYTGKRSPDWVKVKCRKNDDFVVGGYILSDGGAKSLLIGERIGGELRYVGAVGSGLTSSDLTELGKSWKKRKTSPFAVPPKKKNAVWVTPSVTVRVEYAERTLSGVLRQPSFKGICRDKKEESETSGKTGGVVISSPDKIIFPIAGFTKSDVARYYEGAANAVVPFLKDRTVAVVRCYGAVDKSEKFFKKHPSCSAESKHAVTAGGEEFIGVGDMRSLLGQVQLGSIEFHIPVAKAGKAADFMVFDLDPDERLSTEELRRGATDLKSVLDMLSLPSFIKTSGGKGYHILVPVSGGADTAEFSRTLALYMAKKWEDMYTANIRKAARKGKLFIDWQRNTRGATFVAPYSLRARPSASVSAPIYWEELFEIAPDSIDLELALKRMKEFDPWKDIFSSAVKLKSSGNIKT